MDVNPRQISDKVEKVEEERAVYLEGLLENYGRRRGGC